MHVAGAVLSACGKYRYELMRGWPSILHANEKHVVWVMLNPSTADANTNDPTIRRCIQFSADWGYSSLLVVNLFAYRATDPDVLLKDPIVDYVGPNNDRSIVKAIEGAAMVVAAWSGHPAVRARGKQVLQLLQDYLVDLRVLGFTLSGHPRHPLYVSKETEPTPWRV